MEFYIHNQLVTEQEIWDFEREYDLTLPNDYREHLLKYNGGAVTNSYLYFKDYDSGIRLSSFQPLKYGNDTIEKSYKDSRDYLPERYINVGYTGTGNICMSLQEQNYGFIYIYYSEVELEFVANSFTEFLDGLVDYSDDFEEQ